VREKVNSLVLLKSELPNRFHQGKVRDTYDLGDHLLMVATDRISAFDVVLPTGIPDKGLVLTQLSAHWFEATKDVVPNHFVRVITDPHDPALPYELPTEFLGRSTLIRKAERVDYECVARGYISGSAWAEYASTGQVTGQKLPRGLGESEELPEPIFTPTTKEETGHDMPITNTELIERVGLQMATVLRLRTLSVYRFAAELARQRGIIIADTKFEFGSIDGELSIIDELLTPDSSRFWPVESYESGHAQPSFDKQFVRDWLVESGWNKEPPAPELPSDVVERTAEKYRQAFTLITGRELWRPAN
jgi:phosphoribosylaminoimidazole-succinocarboxamide synthase